MMKLFYVVFILAVNLFYLSGCSPTPFAPTVYNVSTSTTTIPDTGGKEYYPNNDGYSWTYNIGVSDAGSQRGVVSFNGVTTIEGQEFQILKVDNNKDTKSVLRLIKVDDNSAKDFGLSTDLGTQESVLLTFPLKVGNSWNISSQESASVDAIEDVTVSVGVFKNCFKVSYTFSNRKSQRWYAKNIGVIKRIDNFDDGLATNWQLAAKNF